MGDLKKLPELLKNYLKEHHLTEKEFGRRVGGACQNTVSSWKSGEKQPRGVYLDGVCAEMKVTLDD